MRLCWPLWQNQEEKLKSVEITTKRATQFDYKVLLKVEDAGLYTCLASSLAGEDGKNYWIRVQGEFLFNSEETFHPS